MSKSIKFWDALSKNYDKNAKDTTYDTIIANTPKYLNKEDVILDFACATGLYSIAFASQVKYIDAFDLSPKMIELARKEAKIHQINNVSFSCSTLEGAALAPEKYDVILALNILLYFKDVKSVTQQLHRLLKPNGILITSTACLTEKRSFLAVIATSIIFILKKLQILPYLKFLKMDELEQTIGQSGFEILETEIIMDSPATEYYIVGKKR